MTDAAISKELLQEALSADVCDTYNMISVDGDTSTNDTVLLLANGMAENPKITEKNEDYRKFCEALNYVNTEIAKMMAGDGEGATALFEFDPEKVDLVFESAAGSIQIIKNGIAVDYSEEEATRILSEPAVTAIANMNQGNAEATAWGCDLTYDYVKINADYRS